MATVTVVAIERSGPAIRAALAEHAPGDEHLFEAELRDAVTRAADDLDLAGRPAGRTRPLARTSHDGCQFPHRRRTRAGRSREDRRSDRTTYPRRARQLDHPLAAFADA